MGIIILILLGLSFYQFLRQIRSDADYLGQNSSLKMQLKEKDLEISKLKNEIYRLEHPVSDIAGD